MSYLHTHTYRFLQIILFAVCAFFVLSGVAVAQTPDPTCPNGGRIIHMMQGIPGLAADGCARTLPEYINEFYLFLITVGAIIGVIKIAIAGFKYATSDIISSKESARTDIRGVFLGLIILLLPYLVLRALSPNAANLDVLDLPQIGVQADGTSGGGFLDALNNVRDNYLTQNERAIEENPYICGQCNLQNRERRGGRTQCEALREVCGMINGVITYRPGQETINECRMPTICPPLPVLPPR
jgi:hypothetical protein